MMTSIEVIKRNGEKESLQVEKVRKILQAACEGYPTCTPDHLLDHMEREIYGKGSLSSKEIINTLIQLAVERTSVDNPNWQFVAARLLTYNLYKEAAHNRKYRAFGYGDFYDLLERGTAKGWYGAYLLDAYNEEQVRELGFYIEPKRDDLFNYVGLKTLSSRYLVRDFDKKVFELPQERFMVVAMHLASLESDKVARAKAFYDALSKLEMTVATPTLSNSGKPHHQLSSCFIDTVPDSLYGIYNTDMAFARVSKHGGGMGIYIGKVRSRGSAVRGHKGASGGVIPWIKNYNNTAISVDQLGVRAGAVAIYLDVWHKDILDFLNLKTNNGDDRMKAHDIFPAVTLPDIFMKTVEERGQWYLFDPHDVQHVMGFRLEDCFDDATDGSGEFTRRYLACVHEPKLKHEKIAAIEIMKRILTSQFETGTPFVFFRDTVNRANPNKHKGMIYSSNLCTEICQNMSETTYISEEVVDENGDHVIVTRQKSGDFVVCNLSSLNLGRMTDDAHIEKVVKAQMRMMDNVIDLNYYPIPQAKITNKKYRAVGLGTSGYHQYLSKRQIQWESDEHIQRADELYESIAFYAIEGSMEIAKEKGTYPAFSGSEWQTGVYFERRGYITIDENGEFQAVPGKERWLKLAQDVQLYGMRNAWTFAIAPTGSTSLISGSTASIDPVFSKFFIEEKRGQVTPQTAPDLNPQTFWFYKEAHKIDQKWSIWAAGKRQTHIDQAQSFNLYITPNISSKEFLSYLIEAWKVGVKTIYYVRNQSLEVEDCVSCSS